MGGITFASNSLADGLGVIFGVPRSFASLQSRDVVIPLEKRHKRVQHIYYAYLIAEAVSVVSSRV